MKKLIILLLTAALFTPAFSQKMGYVDTDYILDNIPSYKEAQEQLDELSKQWQQEIEERYDDIHKLRKQFEIDKLLLTEDMKYKKEQEIIKKEKDVKDLQRKRFGVSGDRFRKEQELMKPIQDEVFNAIKDISINGNYGMILDAASSNLVMVFTDPRYDISEEVLKKLGYIK